MAAGSAGGRVLRTARLVLRPVNWSDLSDVTRLKTDPSCFALMLGGVRSPGQAASEMADDIRFWSEAGVGIFTMRASGAPNPATSFRGITGVHRRPDGRGIGLRFALAPIARGQGLAREAAGRALRFTHDEGVGRIVAVCREDNRASRLVLGGIGMRPADTFRRDGNPMLVYESVRFPLVGS